MTARLVLGMDIGGTWSRALVADVAGGVLGTGQAGGGNSVSHGTAGPTAIRDALAGVDTEAVGAVVFGLAGGDIATRDRPIAEAMGIGWRQAGLRCTPVMVSDVVLDFVSGTGAVAAAVRDRTIERCADGPGWLLGDRGSGFWIGRAAVAATLTALDRDRDRTLSALGGEVTDALEVARTARRAGGRTLVAATIEAAHRRPPVTLAELAPLVRSADAARPIVLGGGLLTTPNPLSLAVRAFLTKTWPHAPIRTAGDTAAAAAWLAAARLLPDASHALYAKVVGSPDE